LGLSFMASCGGFSIFGFWLWLEVWAGSSWLGAQRHIFLNQSLFLAVVSGKDGFDGSFPQPVWKSFFFIDFYSQGLKKKQILVPQNFFERRLRLPTFFFFFFPKFFKPKPKRPLSLDLLFFFSVFLFSFFPRGWVRGVSPPNPLPISPLLGNFTGASVLFFYPDNFGICFPQASLSLL